MLRGDDSMDGRDEEASQEQLDELLQVQVQLLFHRIQEGRFGADPTRLPWLESELAAVQFDRQGVPLLSTVSARVRSLARTFANLELARLDEVREGMAAESPIRGVLPEAVEVTAEILAACAQEGDFLDLAIRLYEEAFMVVAATCCIYPNRLGNARRFPRNQAICVGSLVHICKFMSAVAALSHNGGYYEVIYALNRSIIEPATTVRFLVKEGEGKYYDQFVQYSLGPERELYDVVSRNVQARGGVSLPVELSMLRSIERLCEKSGLKIEDVSAKPRDWAGGMRQRLEAVHEEGAYAGLFRLPSHAIHGTWADLMLHHLVYEDGEFLPNLEPGRSDVRLLLPAAFFVLMATHEYLGAYFGDTPTLRPLYERITDLSRRIGETVLVDSARRDEQWQMRQERGEG